ncbi:MAG: polysaccharide deacetylase family protein [Pseudolabrys sp.]
MAQSGAEPASPPKPAEQAAAQSVAKPAEQPLAQPAVVPIEKTVVQPIAAPIVKIATASAAAPIEKAAVPGEKAAVQPDTKPVEHTDALPAAPVEKASLRPEPKPEAKPEAKPAARPESKQLAESCPGHPNALGTSRVLTVSPDEFSRIGTIQYKQTLPLNDHEVVLTFDDGPIPPYSNIILDALEAQCVKATYFMVGEMAHSYPSIVRRIYNAGMTIGTHSQHHPFGFERLSMDRVEREVDGGIASVDAALGDPKAVAPFFRIPGFGRTNAIERFLQAKGLMTWSADIDTDDWWRGSTPGAVLQRAMRRLNARGRGIILMHDIHPATALVLPSLLRELKAQGYHVVQVVPAGERPKSVPELVAKPSEDKGNWPRVTKASVTAATSNARVARHRIKKAAAEAEPALHHRLKKVIASRERPARHHKKVLASIEPAPRHHVRRAIGGEETVLRHRVKQALANKRRPAVASARKQESAAPSWLENLF